MNRISVIQEIVQRKSNVTYLEIGVAHGNVILQVKANRRIGVEPRPPQGSIITEQAKTDHTFLLYQQTSDEFFQIHASKLFADGVDVVFVDGLHSYQQALRDVENSLRFLNEDGVIVMHDCNPLSFATAYPTGESFDEVLRLAKEGEIPGWNGCWNGDVWKALVHLRITRDDLNIFTLDLDWGLGIITKSKRRRKMSRLCGLEKLQSSDYSLLEKNRVKFLNLKPPKYFNEFMAALKKSEPNIPVNKIHVN